LGSRFNLQKHFCLQIHFKVSAEPNIFPLFVTEVIDTGGKFAADVVDTGGKLPLVSFTPAANLQNWWQNLPPLSLIPVQICRQCL
jgi:hypothetical protein